MININITTTEGDSIGQLQVPQKVSEVKLSQYINLEKYIENNLPGSDIDESGLVLYMLGCLKSFFGGDKVTHLTLGKIGEMSESINEESAQSLTNLYYYIVNIVKGYKPEARQVQWNGYKWNKHTRDAVLGRIAIDKLPTWQAVEAMEVRRVFEVNLENDKEGSFRYTYLLKLASILAVKTGEKLPRDESAINQLISDRMKVFQEIPMDIALSIESFFFSTGKGSAKTRSSNTFSSRQKRDRVRRKKGTHFTRVVKKMN